MASFSDHIPTFNPYVQQLPVDAMVSVGLQKQQQYNQGIERIQSQIDSIAGLDIARESDRQYLQTKLNEVGGDLKKVAAGDFSNYQLVNSVGGMINKISKDRRIQNAVSSTIKYKKGLQELEEARKEGKSGPSNEADFYSRAANWLNSTDPNASFDGGFTPYTNYHKNAIEVFKSLVKDETITDDAFKVDEQGRMVVTDSTVRRKLAGIDPDTIQRALMAGLSAADFKQMELDGKYYYANVPADRLLYSIRSSYQDKIGFYTAQKKILEDAKSTTTSNVEKENLDNKIASLDKMIDKLSNEYSGMTNMIAQGNLDGVKAHLHTANFLDNFARAFSYTETSATYQGKTPQEMKMWRSDKEQQWKQFVLGLEWDKQKFAITTAQKERELAQKDSELSGTYGGVAKGVSQADLPEITLERFISDTDQLFEDVKNADLEILSNPTYEGKDEKWLEDQYEAWQKRPSNVDPVLAEHFRITEDKRRRAATNTDMVADIQKKAAERFGTIDDLIPNDSNIVHRSDNGTIYTFTPKDIVVYNQKRDRYIKSEGIAMGAGPMGGYTGVRSKIDFQKAKEELSPKEYELLRIDAGETSNRPKELLDRMTKYGQEINRPFAQTIKEINAFTKEEVSKRISISQGVAYRLQAAKPEQRDQLGNILMNFASIAEEQKGKLPESPDFDVEAARQIAVSPNVRYSLTVVDGTEYQPRMYEMEVLGTVGGKEISTKFRITPEQKDRTFGRLFEKSPEQEAFTPYAERIRKMGGKTTASGGGKSTHQNAFLSSIDFPQVGIYGVKANIQTTPSGRYSLRLSVYDPIQGKWVDDIPYPRQGTATQAGIIEALRSINDAELYRVINEKEPSLEDLKELQEAAKKPF